MISSAHLLACSRGLIILLLGGRGAERRSKVPVDTIAAFLLPTLDC